MGIQITSTKQDKKQSIETLCRKVWEVQRSKEWPGLAKEVTDICTQLNIPDVNEVDVDVAIIKTAVFDHHYRELKKKSLWKRVECLL